MDPFTMAYNVVVVYAQVSVNRQLLKHEALMYAAACNVMNGYFLTIEERLGRDREEANRYPTWNVGEEQRKKGK